jgi:protein-S-isoprenylcysteine O-methyltransferase Ste14
MNTSLPHPPPNTIPWPPILFVAFAASGIALHWTMPLPWPQGAIAAALLMLGLFFVAAAIALELAAVLAFRKARTTILPHRAASELITSGPFRLTRNPIYVGNTMLVLGVALVFGVGWLVVSALLAAIAVHHFAVLREERHLSVAFGEAWRDYAARVPRWVVW